MNSNIDVKHLAHSLLNRSQHAKQMPELQKPALAPHIVRHAHEYITKVMKAKGLL